MQPGKKSKADYCSCKRSSSKCMRNFWLTAKQPKIVKVLGVTIAGVLQFHIAVALPQQFAAAVAGTVAIAK